MGKKILVAASIPKASIEWMRKEGYDVAVVEGEPPQRMEDFDAVFIRGNVRADSAFLSRLRKGCCLIRLGAGLDNVDLDAAKDMGIQVFNTPGSSSVSVAEHVMGLTLALAKRIPECNYLVKSGSWPKKACGGIELRGKTMGIVGFGSTGAELARLASAFGMRVLAYDKYRKIDGKVAEAAVYEELLTNSDFLSFHVPLTEETRSMFNASHLVLLKRGVFIINASRGEVVDAEALLDGLAKGIIAGAALDVLPHEPPMTEAEKQLLKDARVIFTPHVAGSTEDAEDRAVKMACQILEKG